MNRSILALHTRGSFVVRAAIRQLNDRDVRQRRRAVRKLFELNDSTAIDAFIPLLDDSDEWFREKALLAIQKWASMKDLELAERLASSQKVEERVLALQSRKQKLADSVYGKEQEENFAPDNSDALLKLFERY